MHAGLMMVPLVLGNMGVKRLVVRVVNGFGYRRVLVGATLALAGLVLLLPLAASLGLPWAIPAVLLVIGMVNGVRFSTMNNLTLKDLPDALASSGNSLMSMTQQLTMSIGVTVAGLLLAAAAAGAGLQAGFATVWLGVAIITALPALVFWQVPEATPATR
ncbi:hypothetical protein LN139_08315 [Pseudomonas sp. KNUC1026]|nr:hypothetical protein [Pseudomonas sp. KNUC1026]UFH51044.1 hypothetical protein LN139_08315 [Pseudomonas sp. KNUC1026]